VQSSDNRPFNKTELKIIEDLKRECEAQSSISNT